MTCILYREGKGTVEHGISCESTACEVEHLDGLIKAGWSVNPPGYTPPKVINEADDGDDNEAINPVRIKAREAGIDGWDTRRIGTLEKMLGA